MKKIVIEPLRQPDRIINYWKKEKLVVAFIIVFGLGFNIATVLGPIYQGKLIDALLRGYGLHAVIKLAATFILLIGAIQFMRYLKRFYIRRFANKTIATMRLMIYNNIIGKSYVDLINENTGDLMTRALSDVDLCVEGMRKFTTEIFDTGVLMASYFVAMLYYDVKITILGALFIPAAMMIAEKLKNIIYKYSIAYRSKSSMITGMTFDYIENAMLYRISGLEVQAAEKYRLELDDLQMQEGKVMSSELLPKLAAELHKTYGKAAVDAAKEGRAGLALFRNEVFETTAAIGARLLPAVNSIARSMADAMKTWREQPSGGWTNLLQGFSPNSAEYTDAWLRETFRLPTRDVALTDRDTRIANRLDNNHAARGSYDPQMSRAMADRRARQEEENERRAAKERFEAGKAERDKAAKEAEAAAEKARQDYNRGVQLYNRLVDNYNSLRPDLSETDRIILKLHDDVAALSKEHPEQAADAQRMEGKIISLLREADARKVANAQLKEEIKLLEKLNEDMTGFGGFAQGLGMNALELPKVGGTLGRDGRVTGNMPRFSLTGTAETGGFNGNSPENARAQEDADERRKIEERLNQDLLASKMKFGEESLALLELTSKKGSAIAIGAAVAQKALAVAQILMNSNSAATAALLPPPVGLGPIAGQALSAEIRAMGYLNAAMTGAIGIAQVAGGRASGGLVSAGQTYLVGEKGPELLTMGAADGYVTPNHALGGSTIQINNSYDFSGADAGTIQRLRAEINQSSERTKAQILASMNRGGEFALASGRAR